MMSCDGGRRWERLKRSLRRREDVDVLLYLIPPHTPAPLSDVCRNCDCANAPPLQQRSTTSSKRATPTSPLHPQQQLPPFLLLLLVSCVSTPSAATASASAHSNPKLPRFLTLFPYQCFRFDWLELLSLPICRGQDAICRGWNAPVLSQAACLHSIDPPCDPNRLKE